MTVPNAVFDAVLRDVIAERNRQDVIWGEQNHQPVKWLSILGEEYGEACTAYNDSAQHADEIQHYREELVQVAAVAFSAIESFDRGNQEGW